MTWQQLFLYAGFGTASFVELFWTAIGIICIVINAQQLIDAYGDKRALKKDEAFKRNGARHIVASGAIRSRWRDMFLFIGVTLLGLSAMSSSPSVIPNHPSIYSIAIPIVCLAFELGFAACLFWDRRDRLELLRLVRRDNTKVPKSGLPLT